jgi:hypothetical protein
LTSRARTSTSASSAAQQDGREGLAKLGRWAAGVTVGFAGVAVFLTLFFVGNYWPRKNAARRIRDAGRFVVALLPAATADAERARFQDALDCTVRAVWTDSLPKEEALPLAEACLAAIRDGEVSPDEMAAIRTQASALCLRGGGSQRR